MPDQDSPNSHRQGGPGNPRPNLFIRILDGAVGNSLGEQFFEGLVTLALLWSGIGIVFATRWGIESHPQTTSTILFLSLLALAYGVGVLVRSTRREEWKVGRTLTAVALIAVPSLGWR